MAEKYMGINSGTYADGIQHYALAFRIDNSKRTDWKQLVCCQCVLESQLGDSLTVSGHYLCESCEKPCGDPLAFQRGVVLQLMSSLLRARCNGECNDNLFPQDWRSRIVKQVLKRTTELSLIS